MVPTLYCKRRKFRREFNFVDFVYLKKYESNIHDKFSSAWFASLSIVSSCFYSFPSLQEYKIKFQANGFEGKVRIFSPTKIPSFTVHSKYRTTLCVVDSSVKRLRRRRKVFFFAMHLCQRPGNDDFWQDSRPQESEIYIILYSTQLSDMHQA